MRRLSVSVMFFLLALSLTVEMPTARAKSIHSMDYPDYRPGVIVVKFKPEVLRGFSGGNATGISSIDQLMARFEVSRLERRFSVRKSPRRDSLPDLNSIYELSFPIRYNPITVATAFATNPAVEYAEPRYVDKRCDTVPNDSLYAQQWFLPQIQAPAAWDLERGDSTVIIAIVDDGVDWRHPDLVHNIWQNLGEDTDGDGHTIEFIDDEWVFDPGDLNGVDDDDWDADPATFVDDLVGWDMGENDNDPTGRGSHGTLVGGAASAITDNRIGVASIGWNCKIMAVKAADVDNQLAETYEGIVYAAENGAHVINNSWGRHGRPIQSDQEVLYYVNGLGCIVVAAAGNEFTSDLHYPSAYEKVVSVAATRSNDRMATFTNYGDWVDVSAPGVDILTTSPNERYGKVEGTSLSSPVAAGLLGLVKSHNPGWSNRQVAEQTVFTADDIDAHNPGFEGLLGTGRINAYRALTEIDPPEPLPALSLQAYQLDDSPEGNGNGVLDQGERVDLTAELRNYRMGTGTNLVVSLTALDPDLSVVDGSATVAYIPADTTFHTQPDRLVFQVDGEAEPHMGELEISFVADGGLSGVDTLSVIVGLMPILLVDDDDGDNNVEGWYTEDLDSLDIPYGYWDRNALGKVSVGMLPNFPIVVWLCEWAFPSLDEDDRAAISAYLDAGGNLFISGQDIGWDLADPTGDADNQYSPEALAFFNDYLHSIYWSDDSPIHDVVGVSLEEPIGSGLEFSVWQPGREPEYQFPEEIEPNDGAEAIFEYVGGRHHKAGIKYDGDHRLVYLGFGYEAIEDPVVRSEVLVRILNWLNPIEHEQLTETEDTEHPFTITAHLRDASQPFRNFTLYWKAEGDPSFTSVAMDSLGGGWYSGQIPAPHVQTTISYYIWTEAQYYAWTWPAGAPVTVHSFYVGPDFVPPTIDDVDSLGPTVSASGSREVNAFVQDNIGVGDVTLYAWAGDGSPQSFTMSPTGYLDEYRGQMFWTSQGPGDEVYYYVLAVDSSSNENQAVSDTLSFQIVDSLLIDDFETESDKWETGLGWGIEADIGVGGSDAITDSPNENYDDNTDNPLTLLEPFNLSTYATATLHFYHFHFFKANDFGYVEISTDGQQWTQLVSYTGLLPPPIKSASLSLNDFCGEGFDSVWVRFRVVSDGTQNWLGWTLDHISISVKSSGVEEACAGGASLPTSFSIGLNYPNPFNPLTTIPYALPQVVGARPHITLKIHNLLGQTVRTLVDEPARPGFHHVIWDGRSNAGEEVGSGIYFVRMLVVGEGWTELRTRKVVFMK